MNGGYVLCLYGGMFAFTHKFQLLKIKENEIPNNTPRPQAFLLFAVLFIFAPFKGVYSV